MAWMARHLFFECSDREALAEALVALLVDPDLRANLEGLLDPPGRYTSRRPSRAGSPSPAPAPGWPTSPPPRAGSPARWAAGP